MKPAGDYRPVHAKILDDARFTALSPDAQLLWFYLRLRLGRSGIDIIFEGQLRGVGNEAAIKELQDAGFLEVEGQIHWLVEALRYEGVTSGYVPGNVKHRKGIENHLASLPEQSIVNRCARLYGLEPPFPHLDDPDGDPRPTGPTGPAGPHPNGGESPAGGMPNTETETKTETLPRTDARDREPNPRSERARMGGDDRWMHRERAKSLIFSELLRGVATVEVGGRTITLDDQLVTWDRLTRESWSPEELNGALGELRSVLEGPLANEPFGFGLLLARPALLNQARAAFEKRRPVSPTVGELAGGILNRRVGGA